MLFRVVFLACALLIGACGNSQPTEPEKGTAAGVQAEEQFFDQLGVKQVTGGSASGRGSASVSAL